MPPWECSRVVLSLAHALLWEALKHDTKHSLSVPLFIHVPPTVKKATHGGYMVGLDVRGVKVLDWKARPADWRTEDVVQSDDDIKLARLFSVEECEI